MQSFHTYCVSNTVLMHMLFTHAARKRFCSTEGPGAKNIDYIFLDFFSMNNSTIVRVRLSIPGIYRKKNRFYVIFDDDDLANLIMINRD